MCFSFYNSKTYSFIDLNTVSFTESQAKNSKLFKNLIKNLPSKLRHSVNNSEAQHLVILAFNEKCSAPGATDVLCGPGTFPR